MNLKPKNRSSKYDFFVRLLQGAGLRPTRQRLALAGWLFDGIDKHVTAEQVHAKALKLKVNVSLATIYNTLNNFLKAGLLRSMAVDGGPVFFDTNQRDHFHLYDEKNRCLCDIPASSVRFSRLPKLPLGKALSRIDVVLRISVPQKKGRTK